MPVFAAKGTRDFLPAQMRRRLAVIQAIREVYASYGFEPLDTPAMERVETLMGKYGEEGDRLIFKILERGEGGREGKADLALRYDLTVPLARVMAMNQGIPLPFKRYQVAPVWRADRPQKGRFREFYQCDGDIVGTTSLLADAECIAMAHDALVKLGFDDFVVHVNHRAWLRWLVVGQAGIDPSLETAVLVELDKFDKVGESGVHEGLMERGLEEGQVVKLLGLIKWWREQLPAFRANPEHFLGGPDAVGDVGGLSGAEAGAAGLKDLRGLFLNLRALGIPEKRVEFEPSLARGLGYYTGTIYEIKLTNGGVGTVAAGGRYDGLIGMFSGKQVPAVGISIGLERILVVMEERGMSLGSASAVSVLVTVDEGGEEASASVAAALRRAGVPTELWLGKRGDLGKQYRYAEQRGVPFAVDIVAGDADSVNLKVLGSPGKERFTRAALIARLAPQ